MSENIFCSYVETKFTFAALLTAASGQRSSQNFNDWKKIWNKFASLHRNYHLTANQENEGLVSNFFPTASSSSIMCLLLVRKNTFSDFQPDCYSLLDSMILKNSLNLLQNLYEVSASLPFHEIPLWCGVRFCGDFLGLRGHLGTPSSVCLP